MVERRADLRTDDTKLVRIASDQQAECEGLNDIIVENNYVVQPKTRLTRVGQDSRLSILWQRHKCETLRAWSKPKTGEKSREETK